MRNRAKLVLCLLMSPVAVSAQSPSRQRVVRNQQAPSAFENTVSADAGATQANPLVRLEPAQPGDTIIRGVASGSISEVVVEILIKPGTVQSDSVAAYSHARQVTRDSLMAYRVVHVSPPEQRGRTWPFTIHLSKPLSADQTVRVARGAGAGLETNWSTATAPVVAPTGGVARAASDKLVSSPRQSRMGRQVRSREGETGDLIDPCAGDPNLREIEIDWETGSIRPTRLAHSGNYCVRLINANNILYSYVIRVESVEVEGNPLEILKPAVEALKSIVEAPAAPGAGTPKTTSNPLTIAAHECELPALIDAIKPKAADLQQAFAAFLPNDSGEKVASIKLAQTLAAWNPIPPKFNEFGAAAEMLRRQLIKAGGTADCTDAQVSEAWSIIGNYDKVKAQYDALLQRVNSPHIVKVREDDLDAADQVKVSVKEYYGARQTAANELKPNISPGYSLITSSAGFLVTSVPARSYTSSTVPNPANPTTTQNVLGVDYGGGMRPALVALINYNLPYIRQRRFGLALSAGPVFDISAGKADTSKFGFFGGISARFSKWLYVTPGFHVGEFADFPQGYTNGQVIPAGQGTPNPTKRYTTRFALAVTYKIRDLGATSPPAQ